MAWPRRFHGAATSGRAQPGISQVDGLAAADCAGSPLSPTQRCEQVSRGRTSQSQRRRRAPGVQIDPVSQPEPVPGLWAPLAATNQASWNAPA